MPFSQPVYLLAILLLSCNYNNATQNAVINKAAIASAPASPHYAIVAAIPLPEGYKRISVDTSSFAAWLRAIQLKTSNTVYLFNGLPKQNQSAQFAVLDISVGKKDLQQCADAVMRLRAEYLFSKKDFSSILFTDNEGTAYYFKQPYTRQNFDSYLNKVFGMCGTASLSKQLKTATMQNIMPGDVLIHGGFPGHAEIVLDVAVNIDGSEVYLLAQSYMPAQDIHILKDLGNTKLSPWYKVKDSSIIETPEYSFNDNELKSW